MYGLNSECVACPSYSFKSVQNKVCLAECEFGTVPMQGVCESLDVYMEVELIENYTQICGHHFNDI